MNGREALAALEKILADHTWMSSTERYDSTGSEREPYPAETHGPADDLLVELVREHVPDSEAFLKLYDEMEKWYE